MIKNISYVDLGISINCEKLKKFIIEKWKSGEIYTTYYDQGYRGEELYGNILHELMYFIEDFENDIREKTLKNLGLSKAQVWYDKYPKTDVRSIGWEVMRLLDLAFDKKVEELTTDDIPFILEFLDTPSDKTLEAWDKWENYWKKLDYPARRKKLLGNNEK